MEKALQLHTHRSWLNHTHSGCQRVKRIVLGLHTLFFCNYFRIDEIKMFFLFMLMLPNTSVIVLLFSLRGTRTRRNPLKKKTPTSTLTPTVSRTHRHAVCLKAAPSLVIAWGEHLCHCCGNSYGETSILFHIFPMTSHKYPEMQIACCQYELQTLCFSATNRNIS